MAIDLSKLKALELPTKEIEVEILGEVQRIKINCPDETVAALISNLWEIRSADDPKLPVEVMRIFLAAALVDNSADDIELLLKRDFAAATKIAAAGRDLLTEFTKQKAETKTALEKNLKAGASEIEEVC